MSRFSINHGLSHRKLTGTCRGHRAIVGDTKIRRKNVFPREYPGESSSSHGGEPSEVPPSMPHLREASPGLERLGAEGARRGHRTLGNCVLVHRSLGALDRLSSPLRPRSRQQRLLVRNRHTANQTRSSTLFRREALSAQIGRF